MSDLLTSIARTPEDKRQPEDEKSFHVAKTVRKSATDVTVKRVAVEKHIAHNKSLRMESAEMKTAWILPFASPPQKIAFRCKNTKNPLGRLTTESICICAGTVTTNVLSSVVCFLWGLFSLLLQSF